MTPNRRVLYISYDGMADSLGRSQVIPYVLGLARRGWDMTILSCEKPERLSSGGGRIRDILAGGGVRWRPIPFTRFPPVAAKLWDQARLIHEARRLHREAPLGLIHCRSYVAMEAGTWVKRAAGSKLLFDMRGFWADERVEGGLWNMRNPAYRLAYAVYKKREAAYLRAADSIVILSENGKRELTGWPAYPGTPVTVIPCCADFGLFDLPEPEERTRARAELGLEPGALILGYLGWLRAWYMLDEMASFFSALRARVPGARFLFLTPDPPELVRRAFESRGLDFSLAVIRSVQREDVPRLLAAADVGVSFIIRTWSKIATSPTKLGEYLAMGLPVFVNSGVGDVAEVVRRIRGGFVLDDFKDGDFKGALDSLPALLALDRAGIRSRARAEFDLETGIARYDAIYRNLLNC